VPSASVILSVKYVPSDEYSIVLPSNDIVPLSCGVSPNKLAISCLLNSAYTLD